MRRVRWWVLVALPALLGLVGGVVLLVRDPPVRVQLSAPPATVAVLAGVAVTGVILTVLAMRRGLERARATATARAREESSHDHDRFLARLDHELKNPVMAMRAALAAHRSGSDSHSVHLDVADAQSARLAGLVGELRKLAELRSRPLEREAVDLEEIADDVVAELAQQLRASGSGERDFVVHFPDVPWQVPAISGDPDLLHLAVYNVVANAAKFTGPGGRIEIRGAEDDGWVTVEVADTGAGIPAGEQDAVWEELSRASNARGAPGSGLGLALVRVVVERHGGTVQLRSREGQGTSVRLRLPTRSG